MVSYANVAQLPEGSAMVRRDPALRDTFPELKARELATDKQREMYAVRPSARIVVPVCLSAYEIGQWAQSLKTLSEQLQVIAQDTTTAEIWQLQQIVATVKAFNKTAEEAVTAHQNRMNAKNSRAD